MASLIDLLIVDDEPMILMSMEDFFSETGFRVATADSAELGLEIVRRQHIDAAIIDYRLPGMDGEVMVAELRKLNPGVKVFLHSGSHDYTLTASLAANGITAAQIFFKPANLFEMAKTIKTAVQPAG